MPGRRVIALLLAALGIALLPAGLLALGLSTVPGCFTGWAAGWIAVAAVLSLAELKPRLYGLSTLASRATSSGGSNR